MIRQLAQDASLFLWVYLIGTLPARMHKHIN